MAVTDDDDQGGGGLSYDGDSEVTGGEGGYLEKVTEGDMGEGGFSGPPKKGDVIYERPLIETCQYHYKHGVHGAINNKQFKTFSNPSRGSSTFFGVEE